MARWRRWFEPRVQTATRRLGFEVRRASSFGANPFADVRSILEQAGAGANGLVVVDVGANTGQTVRRVRDFFPDAAVHAFEPDAAAFEELSRAYGATPGVHLNKVALGSVERERLLLEHESTAMSSFLTLGPDGWGAVRGSTLVPVVTLDGHCRRAGIERVDVLKIDTQGFELEVLAGAAGLLDRRQVSFVLLEVNFAPIYEGIPGVSELFDLLGAHGFALVSLYGLHHIEHRAGWADALFTIL